MEKEKKRTCLCHSFLVSAIFWYVFPIIAINMFTNNMATIAIYNTNKSYGEINFYIVVIYLLEE